MLGLIMEKALYFHKGLLFFHTSSKNFNGLISPDITTIKIEKNTLVKIVDSPGRSCVDLITKKYL